MPELRQRTNVPSSAPGASKIEVPAASQRRETRSGGIGFLDVIRILVTLVAVSCGLSYYLTSSESLTWGYKPWFTNWSQLARYIVRFSPGQPGTSVPSPLNTDILTS
jgi:hypothetical protein